MFGNDPCVRVCCGPRCGVDPMHRAVYSAIEAICAGQVAVAPMGCRSRCGDGVTVTLVGGATVKVRDAHEAQTVLAGVEVHSGEGNPAALSNNQP